MVFLLPPYGGVNFPHAQPRPDRSAWQWGPLRLVLCGISYDVGVHW